MPGKCVAALALGSGRLHRFMDRDPELAMHPVDRTNEPLLAACRDNLVAINATLRIDLLGRYGSESLGPAPDSGTGGLSGFVPAANRSRGGKAIIVLPATAVSGNTRRGSGSHSHRFVKAGS